MSKTTWIVAASLMVLPAAGCGGDDGDGDDAASKDGSGGSQPGGQQSSRPRSEPITFAQLSTLPLGTPRAKVLKRVGPPIEEERVKKFGVVDTCFRYESVNDTTGQIDPNIEFRLCYDRRSRLSVKSTAPPPA